MRPLVLKAYSEAIVDNVTTNISRAIDDRTLNFMDSISIDLKNQTTSCCNPL